MNSIDLFRRELQRNRKADTYLLLGNAKQTVNALAHDFARELLQPSRTLEDHPDFLCLDPDAFGVHGLRVEHIADRKPEVLSLERQLCYLPATEGGRAVLLLDVHHMNSDAQAALLKTLEEPPAKTTFFLTSIQLDPILPAIRSRCRTYRVPALTSADALRKATTKGISDENFALLKTMTGSAEEAIALSAPQRETLLSMLPPFLLWFEGDDLAQDWLPQTEGNLQDQRDALLLRLRGALGHIASDLPLGERSPLQVDQTVQALQQASEDILGQITPEIVRSNLLSRKP